MAAIALGPAFADSGFRDLPEISAQDLMAKMTKSDVQQFSGTIQHTGPDLSHGGEKGRDDAGAAASPQSKSCTETVQVAAAGPEKQRVSIDGGRRAFIHNGTDIWEYRGRLDTAVHGMDDGTIEEFLLSITPQGMTKQFLKSAEYEIASVAVGSTTKVAGRDAYQLVITLNQAEFGTETVRVAVDAVNGVPLKLTIGLEESGPPSVIGYTRVDFAKPAASTFTLPEGVKVRPPKTPKTEDGEGGA